EPRLAHQQTPASCAREEVLERPTRRLDLGEADVRRVVPDAEPAGVERARLAARWIDRERDAAAVERCVDPQARVVERERLDRTTGPQRGTDLERTEARDR